MRSFRPEISIEIYHSEELFDLLNTGGGFHSVHGFNLFGLRPNALTSKEITKIFNFFLHEEGFPEISTKAFVLQPLQDNLHFVEMISSSFSLSLDDEDVINVDKDKVKVPK